MKLKVLSASIVIILIVLLAWCQKSKEVEYEEYNDVKDIELSGYNSKLTYDSPFIPWNIPEKFSWDIVELKDYWIVIREWEIISENTWNFYYFSGSQPIIIRDLIHWIDMLLSDEFSKNSCIAFLTHGDEEDIWISALVNWEYSYFNANSSIRIDINKNDSGDIPAHFNFYGSWYLWKNNKYTFFLVDSAMIRNLYYNDYKDYTEYLNKLFLWFKIFDI